MLYRPNLQKTEDKLSKIYFKNKINEILLPKQDYQHFIFIAMCLYQIC